MTKKTSEPGNENPLQGNVDTSREKALLCAHLMLEKKARDVLVLEVHPLTTIAEYFVICSGRSVRQTRAIADHLQSRIKKGFTEIPLGVEGTGEASWILIDYGDVVVHVFYEQTREFYALEKLWSGATRVRDKALAEAAEQALADEDEDEDWGG